MSLATSRSTHAKLGLLASLYFSQGLPFGFFSQTLPVLMRKHGFALGEIGMSALLTAPWALKFVWAPLVDRTARKSWIVPLQLATAAVLAALAMRPHDGSFALLFVAFFLLNALAATQDIATDGLAVDMLAHDERGFANGIQVAGYRFGMILGGGALLILLERLGWRLAFVGMSMVTLAATAPILLWREARSERASVQPRSSFFRRRGAAPLLVLIATYKLGEAFASGMMRPFLSDSGMTLADIGWLIGSAGFVAGLLGALTGGALMNRLGRKHALICFGLIQSAFVFGLAALAHSTPSRSMLYAMCAAEHLASGMATAALFTCMMDWCAQESTATDYTVQASAVVIATGLASSVSGYSAQLLGYDGHFLLAALLTAASVLAVAILFPSTER
jgi:MFS family permease